MRKKLWYFGMAICLAVSMVGCTASSADKRPTQMTGTESGGEEENKGESSEGQGEGNSLQTQEEEVLDRTEKPDASTVQDKLLEAIKSTYGFPFRLWRTEGMELYVVYIFEDHAKREWCSDHETSVYDNLAWEVSGNLLSISGDWTESFTLDLEAETAKSTTSGKAYQIREGYGW